MTLHDRFRAIAPIAALLVLAGCSRMPATGAAAIGPPAISQDAPVELAGGPAPQSSAAAAVDSGSDAPSAASSTALAAQPADARVINPAPAVQDPLEPMNRGLFRMDASIDHVVNDRMKLGALAGRSPPSLRKGLSNLVDNLQEPTTFANEVLQRKAARAARTVVRFVVNSTAGLFGLVDVAGRMGLKRARNDFGKTLAAYGVGPGPYLYLPLAGPTSVRDAVGVAVDGYLSPFAWLRLTAIERNSVHAVKLALHPQSIELKRAAHSAASASPQGDEYAVLRQLHQAKRAAETATPPATEVPGQSTQVIAREDSSDPSHQKVDLASRQDP